MPRDVTTHLNLTYDMLSFAIEYWQVINTLTADWHHELQAYELSEREWIIVSQLCDVLKVHEHHIPWINLSSPHAQFLKDMTRFFSHAPPNLATVIPAMDYINNHLSAQANDHSPPLSRHLWASGKRP